MNVVSFPRSIILALTNFSCIYYLYGHTCLNANIGVIYLRYRLLSMLVPQIFFSNSVSYCTHSSLWCILQFLTSCTVWAAIDHKYLHDEHGTICSRYRPLHSSVA
jgi:hypothetical protein